MRFLLAGLVWFLVSVFGSGSGFACASQPSGKDERCDLHIRVRNRHIVRAVLVLKLRLSQLAMTDQEQALCECG